MKLLECWGDRQSKNRLRMGSRKSPLALWQSRAVAQALVDLAQTRADSRCVELWTLDTRGDTLLDRSLPAIGGKGVFTAELDRAILGRELDFAVHSLKDLPTSLGGGLRVIEVLPRARACDVLVAAEQKTLGDLPPAAVVGTSSPRRQAQLLALRPDLRILPIRGNVQTRLSKIDSGQYDATVLAAAGVERLGLTEVVSEWMEPPRMFPAPGQGAMAATCRQDDEALWGLLEALQDADGARCVRAERFLLERLGGGCSAPIAAMGAINSVGRIELTGRVISLDGRQVMTKTAEADEPLAAAEAVARQLQEVGAELVLQAARRQTESESAGELFRIGGSTADAGLPAVGLRGKTIAVTRAAEQADDMARLVAELGGEASEIPLIAFSAVQDPRAAEEVRRQLHELDWIVFTSTNGIRYFFEQVSAEEIGPRTRLACVGSKSAEALESYVRAPDFVPDRFLGDSLGDQLPLVAGQRVLLPGPVVASPGLAEKLTQRGGIVRRWAVYQTQALRLDSAQQDLIRSCDIVSFASPSAVDALGDQFSDYVAMLAEKTVACIGSMTAQRCRERGIAVDVVPAEFTVASLVKAIASHLEAQRGSEPDPGKE